MDNKSRDIALHRYVLIREAADPLLSPAERVSSCDRWPMSA